jgi:serine/threonine protein phosphatase PrpC
MSTARIACPACGALSVDPTWCTTCAERISPGDALRRGETIAVRLHLPPEQNAPSHVSVTARTEKLTPIAAEPLQSRARRKPAAASAMTIDDAGALAELELIAPMGVQNGVRWWRALDAASGRSLRIEESDEDVENVGVPTLPAIIDVPVGATQVRNLRLRVFRDIAGPSMVDRLRGLGRVLTPREVWEWIEPVLAAVDMIHDAGLVCLRISPWTVTYRENGSIFFRHVDGLFRPSVPSEVLPAITGFAAPETYQLRPGDMPGTAADIYAIGALAWFLIGRRAPPVASAAGWIPLIAARAAEPSFAIGLEPFLRRAMHPDALQRPRTCRDLAQLLRDCVELSELRDRAETAVFSAVACETHIGVAKRLSSPVNQDAVFAASTDDAQLSLLAVADGVSTAQWGSGDLASGIAMARIRRAWDELVADPDTLLGDDPALWLDRILQEANREIVEWIDKRYTPFAGDPADVMATTLVVALVRGSRAFTASIGDSTILLIRGKSVERITREHNMLTFGILEGHSPHQLLSVPWHQALAQCLGAFDIEEDRHVTPRAVPFDHANFGLLPGDFLVLCSDGLIDYIAPSEREAIETIVAMVAAEPVPPLVALEFIVAANRGGGGDNIGVALAAFSQAPLDIVEALAERQGEAFDNTDGFPAVE